MLHSGGYRPSRKVLLAATSLIAMAAAPAMALAQSNQATSVEVVIVTATKRAETIQNVPFSINA